MDLRIGRRGFLKALAGGLATGTGIAGVRWIGVPEVRARIELPGDVAEVGWPAGLHPGRARFVHRVDGRTVEVAPVQPPPPGPDGVVRLVAECGGLCPGRHDFALDGIGGAMDLGGFDVRTFVFGC
jgi:hypothetical protein